jgi:hypothetical protein
MSSLRKQGPNPQRARRAFAGASPRRGGISPIPAVMAGRRPGHLARRCCASVPGSCRGRWQPPIPPKVLWRDPDPSTPTDCHPCESRDPILSARGAPDPGACRATPIGRTIGAPTTTVNSQPPPHLSPLPQTHAILRIVPGIGAVAYGRLVGDIGAMEAVPWRAAGMGNRLTHRGSGPATDREECGPARSLMSQRLTQTRCDRRGDGRFTLRTTRVGLKPRRSRLPVAAQPAAIRRPDTLLCRNSFAVRSPSWACERRRTKLARVRQAQVLSPPRFTISGRKPLGK